MKHYLFFLVFAIPLMFVSLTSCSNDDNNEEEEWVKPSFNNINDIIGKKMIYTDVVDENLNYRYKSDQYHTISFYADGTYKRTYDIYTRKGTYTFSNKTATCKEDALMEGWKTITKYEFINTDKDGYYFKVTSQDIGKDGKEYEPFTLYYQFTLSNAD